MLGTILSTSKILTRLILSITLQTRSICQMGKLRHVDTK